MKEYKTQEAILKHAPELDDEDIQALNECYIPYLFYKEINGVQHCSCSSCHESFEVSYIDRTVTPEQRDFLDAGHNQHVHCPKCGRLVQKKQKGIARSCRNLWEYQRAVFIKPVSKNEVYLLYVWSTKDYRKYGSVIPVGEYMDYTTNPEYEVNAVYYITPNQQRCFIRNPWSRQHQFEEQKIKEPFIKSWWYNTTAWKRGYVIIGDDRLKNTFLQYYNDKKITDCYVDMYKELFRYSYYGGIEFPYCTALCRFAKYPSLEWLAKQGYDDFVFFMLRDGIEAHTLFDWQAKTPFKFFKSLSTQEIKELRSEGRLKRYGVSEYMKYKRLLPGITVIQYSWICENVQHKDRFLKTLQKYGLKIKELIKYFSKSRKKVSDVTLWLDYVETAEKIKFDLSVHNVLFPKNLKLAHDEAVKIKNQIELEEELKALKDKENKYLKRFQTLCDKYSFADATYKVRVPIGAREIINEGNALQHCVGDYAERHLTGKTTILLIRLCKEQDKPLLTVEIDDKTLNIRQVHGLKNRNPTKAEQAFIDEWEKYIHLSKAEKKKNAVKAA